jgi:uncharacterized protein
LYCFIGFSVTIVTQKQEYIYHFCSNQKKQIVSIIGYIAAALIGISLGLIGGGGSILTVPVLVYLFNVNPVLASAYSLFIVGSTSLVGAAGKARQGLVSYKAVIYFGIPSLIAVFSTRKWIVPALPDTFFTIGSFTLTKDVFTLLFFSILMILASISMIRNKVPDAEPNDIIIQPARVAIQGIATGLITGMVGAGGGFLIVPALILLLKLPVKKAMGSSLMIIAINSLIGFTGDLSNREIDWKLILSIAAIAIAGIFAGNYFAKKVSAASLKKGFGWFVLAMGLYIIIKELLLK